MNINITITIIIIISIAHVISGRLELQNRILCKENPIQYIDTIRNI